MPSRGGEVPVGWRLRHELRGDTPEGRPFSGAVIAKTNNLTWAPDGTWLATGANDGAVRVWDPENGKQRFVFKHPRGHGEQYVLYVGAMAEGRTLVAGSPGLGAGPGCLSVWDAITGEHMRTMEGYGPLVIPIPGRDEVVTCKPYIADARYGDARKLVSAVSLTGVERWRYLVDDSGYGPFAAVTPNGRFVLVIGRTTMSLIDVTSGQVTYSVDGRTGEDQSYGEEVRTAAISRDGVVVAGRKDRTIAVHAIDLGTLSPPSHTLERHTAAVTGVAFSPDDKFLVSKGAGEAVRLWDAATWDQLSTLPEEAPATSLNSTPRFHPLRSDVLATFSEDQITVRIWDLDLDAIRARMPPAKRSIHYVTAKIALVGESGVGKSTLGLRIAKNQFIHTESTHGQQFWVVDQLGATRADGAQCEAVLWDFAGQPDYRIVHTLFLDDVDLGLLLFDRRDVDDPLRSVRYWLKHLHAAKGRILVGARSDRGLPVLTLDEIDAFCRERGIEGGYVSTSALTGDGVPDLVARIRARIQWDRMPSTVTSHTFKRIKEFVLALKEVPAEQSIVSLPELRKLLQATDPAWKFSDADMTTAVGHLQKHGYATVLRTSLDGDVMLLHPELLIKLAASIVVAARGGRAVSPGGREGLGALDEQVLRRDGYELPELKGLSDAEQGWLLDGAIGLFLARAICFRERFGAGNLLVFPQLVNVRPPAGALRDFDEGPTYRVSGAVEHVYASLVVLLGYTNTFNRAERWAHRAHFEADGHVCGFQQTTDREGEIELVLYYARTAPALVRTHFQALFEMYLSRAKATVRRYAPVGCPKCGTRQPRQAIVESLESGDTITFCRKCGFQLTLPPPDQAMPLPPREKAIVSDDEARSRRQARYEAALVYVKRAAETRGVLRPTCFVSYAWGDRKDWVERLASDLHHGGIEVILDQWHNADVGGSIPRFVKRLTGAKYVLVVGTPAYLTKSENRSVDERGYVLANEVDLIDERMTGASEAEKEKILPIILDGTPEKSLPPGLRKRVHARFTDENEYFVSLFELILKMYGLGSGKEGSELRKMLCDPV